METNEQEITLNGKIYILKEDTKIDKSAFEMYDLVDEAKIHNKLNKILPQYIECISELWAIKNPVMVLDGANVVLISATSDRAKLILRRYRHIDSEAKMPNLKFNSSINCKYSSDYLIKIISFLQLTEPELDYARIKIEGGNDFPLKLSTKDFEVILAPAVDNS
jgi:hypothetical protein